MNNLLKPTGLCRDSLFQPRISLYQVKLKKKKKKSR